MTTFNPEQFLSTQIGHKLDTKRTPVPEGEYRVAEIMDIQVAPPKSGNEKLVIMNVRYRLENTPVLQKLFGDQPVSVFASINIAVDPNTKHILGGANTNLELGQLMTAAGLNPEKGALGLLKGAGGFTIRVSYRPNDQNPENPWTDVSGWTKAK